MQNKIDWFYIFVFAAIVVFGIGLIIGGMFETKIASDVFGVAAVVIAIYGLFIYG